MKLRSLKSLFLALFGTACFLGLNFSMCGPTGPSTPPKNPKLSDFILTMPGWVAPADSNIYLIYNDTIPEQALTHRIEHFVDGGNSRYDHDSITNASGIKVTALDSGIHQYFFRQDTSDKDKAEGCVLRYFADNWALNTFTRVTGANINSTNKVNIGSFANSVAVGAFDGSIFSAYAHFSKYFIQYYFNKNWRDSTTTNDSIVSIANSYLLRCQSLIQ